MTDSDDDTSLSLLGQLNCIILIEIKPRIAS
jgi:hypothetical protein